MEMNSKPSHIPAATRRFFILFLLIGMPAPPALWAGLSTGLPTLISLLSEAMATELSVPGYSRVRIGQEDWSLTPDGTGASTERPVFRNGSESSWPLVASVFLATAQEGDEGSLVLWAPIGAPRLLMPRDVLYVPLAIGY